MGVVYEALQRSLGRRVALKVLPLAGMLDERRLRRFHNEAHAAAALQHPHIVPVFGVGCERGVHYYAMQLVHGISLAEVLQRLRKQMDVGYSMLDVGSHQASNIQHPASNIQHQASSLDTRPNAALSTIPATGSHEYFRTVVQLGIQAAEALAYAHREGVIHRDIKPSNLLLDDHGKLWITDFGLARMQTDGELTLTGDLLGTLRYMSPEQLTGNKVVDQRTDVYSLGLTLYELLVQQPAFAGVERDQLVRRILHEQPTAPRKLDPTIPVDLETIVLRATAADREARYPSAEALADDLRRFTERKPILARRSTRFQRLRYWARRNPTLAATSALLLLTMAALSIGGPLVAWREATMVREYRRQLDIADLNVAYQAWYEGNVNQVADVLRRHPPDQDSADQRSFAWRYLRSQYDRSQSNIIAHHTGSLNSVAFSPYG
jgi:serine/threonine protein kinase